MVDEARYREAERRLWDSVGVTPREKRIELKAHGISVRIQEAGRGPDVLLIHGGPNAGSTFAQLVCHLPGFHCLMVDRPGTGLSQPLRIDAENLARYGDTFVADVLDGLGLERADVIGSSFGGFLSLRSAAAHPDRIDRLVLLGCPAFVPDMRVPAFMRVLTIGAVRRLMNAMPPNRSVVRGLVRQVGHGASLDAGLIPDRLLEWSLALMQHTDTMRNDGDMIGRLGSVLGFKGSITLSDAALSRVAAKTLLIWGEDDPFGGRPVGERLAQALPAAELVSLQRSGHLPWLDEPAEVASMIAAFLSESREEATPKAGTVPTVR